MDKLTRDCFPSASAAAMTPAELSNWLTVLESAPVDAPQPVRRDSLAQRDLKPFDCPWFSCSRAVPGELARRTWSLLVMTGKPKAGKDTVAEHLVDTIGAVGRVAFSDALMAEVNVILGEIRARRSVQVGAVQDMHRIHEGNKNHPPYRRLLQDWGVIQRRVHGPDYWADRAFETANALGFEGAKLVVVTGARSVGDILGAHHHGAAVWRCERPAMHGVEQDHPIETLLDHVPPGLWDGYLINRDNDLSHLTRQVDLLLRHPPRAAYYQFLKDTP